MFFVEEIIVTGTLIEIFTHPVVDEVEGRKVLEQCVEDIIDDKWLVRLIKVNETGLVVVEEKDSYHEEK
jgi:hypothetical protein